MLIVYCTGHSVKESLSEVGIECIVTTAYSALDIKLHWAFSAYSSSNALDVKYSMGIECIKHQVPSVHRNASLYIKCIIHLGLQCIRHWVCRAFHTLSIENIKPWMHSKALSVLNAQVPICYLEDTQCPECTSHLPFIYGTLKCP